MEDFMKKEDREEEDIPFRESNFWEIVDFINWKNISKDISNVDRNLMNLRLVRKFGRKFCQEAHKVERSKIKALDEISRTYKFVEGTADKKCFGGSDGWWDARSHIVGLGKEEYLRNARNPKLIWERFKDGDYVENFGYWLPREDTKITQPNSSVFIGGEV